MKSEWKKCARRFVADSPLVSLQPFINLLIACPPRHCNRWLAKSVRGTAGDGGILQALLGLCYEHQSTPLAPERVLAYTHRTRCALGGKVLSTAFSFPPLSGRFLPAWVDPGRLTTRFTGVRSCLPYPRLDPPAHPRAPPRPRCGRCWRAWAAGHVGDAKAYDARRVDARPTHGPARPGSGMPFADCFCARQWLQSDLRQQENPP
jgi:hypothetical protein